MASRVFRVVWWILAKTLYVAWVALMIATPLVGFWLASSLVAFDNASQWLALVVGLLLFPIVPVGWELFYVWRRARRGATNKPILTRLDRLVLRTLLVNGAFLGAMMWRAPQTAFRALAVRGDWMLDGHDGELASQARRVLLSFADRFDRRWHADGATTYGTSTEPPPEPQPGQTIFDLARPVQPKDPNGWPLVAEPDALVTAIPDADQTSVESVGKFFAARISDKRVLAKALHDYVVLRLHYDTPTSLLTGEALANRPSQKADDVFAARTGVCEGYARLYKALGEAAGLEMAYITGFIRDAHRNSGAAATDDAIKAALEGNLHAWNAVKIDGQWLFVDATWDDPVSDDNSQTLTETYLFTPPRLFGLDHHPDQDAWQLVPNPIGIGDFARQPLLAPTIGELGIVLEEPNRSQVTADNGAVHVVIGNPFGSGVAVRIAGGEACGERSHDTRVEVACIVPPGQHEIEIYGAKDPSSLSYQYVGSILVNDR
jgi:transglutaminase-like putative cysteine protease